MLGAPILGDKNNITKITVDMVKEFHSLHYTAQNMNIIACGGINNENLLKLSEKYFSSAPLKSSNSIITMSAPAFHSSFVTIRDDAKENTNIGVFYEAPCWLHEDYIPFVLFERLFGQMTADGALTNIIKGSYQIYNSMHKAIRNLPLVKQQCIYSPYREGGIFGNYMLGKYESTKEMLRAAITLPSLYSNYLDDIEALRMKNKFYFDLLQIECPEEVMLFLAQQLLNVGRTISKPELAMRVCNIDLDRLRNVSKQWFKEDPVIVAWGPHIDELKTYSTYKELIGEKNSVGK